MKKTTTIMGITFDNIAVLDDGYVLAERQCPCQPVILAPAIGEINDFAYHADEPDGVPLAVFNRAIMALYHYMDGRISEEIDTNCELTRKLIKIESVIVDACADVQAKGGAE